MSDAFRAIADKLLKWDVLKGIGVRDVAFDPATNTFGLIGPPLKLQSHVLGENTLNNREYGLNTSFGSHFGIEVEVERWPNSYRVRQTKPMWFHGDPGEFLVDFESNLANALSDVYAAMTGEEISSESIQISVIPEPGYPFTPEHSSEYYSAREKKIIKTSMPSWATTVINREGEKKYAADFCKLLPVIHAGSSNAVVGRFDARDLDFIVTHCTPAVDYQKLKDDQALQLKSCEGMLMPSLATGLIPATNFGETVLVVRPDVILASMRPYKKKGVYPVVTYDTDVWTETAGGMMVDASIVAFDQLTGHGNYMYQQHFYVLGPTLKETGFGDEEARMIESSKSLAGAISKKFKLWKRDLTKEKFKDLGERVTGERYGYLESKVHNILGWDCIPLALCPRQFSAKVSKNLGERGFKGKVLAFDVSDDMLRALETDSTLPMEQSEYVKYQYAWICRDVLVNYAKENNAFFNVVE